MPSRGKSLRRRSSLGSSSRSLTMSVETEDSYAKQQGKSIA
jgi:hypothetical protein